MSVQSGAIRAGKAFVEVGSDNGPLQKGLRAASANLKAFGAAVSGMGAKLLGLGTSILAPLAAASKMTADAGSHLADMADRTGVSVEALSRLSYVANQSATDIDALELGLRHMQKTIVEAAKGSKDAAEALSTLGLTINDLKGLSPDKQFALIADRLDKIKDPAVKAAYAMAIFGKGGTALIPMTAGGAKGIAALTKRAEELGLVMSTDDAKAAKALGDGLSELWDVVKMGVFRVGGALAPALTKLSAAFASGFSVASQWINQHRQLVQVVAIAGAGLVAAGAAFFVLGRAISTMGVVVGGVSTAISVATGILGTLATVLNTVLFSGIGLVIGGLGALGAYFAYASDVGGEMVRYLSEGFGILKDDALAAFGGIQNALTAGNWQLAAQVLWAFLRLEFEKGKNVLLKIWNDFAAGFSTITTGVFYGALETWNVVQHGLITAWNATTFAATSAWAEFAAGVKSIWEGTQSWLEGVWLKLFNTFGSLSDEALSKAQQMADQATIDNQKGINDERKRSRDAAEAEYRKAQADEKNRRDQASKENVENYRAATNAIEAAASDKEIAAQKEIDRLKEQLANLTKQAADEAKNPSLGDAAGAPSKSKFIPPDLDSINKQNDSVRGILNPAAFQSLLGGSFSPAERTAKAVEQTARNTDRTVKAIEKIEPSTFG